MQPHDLMYALHVVSVCLHNNKHEQNFCVHILDLISPNYVLVTTQAIDFLFQSHVLLAIASACTLF